MGNLYSYTYVQSLELLKPQVIQSLISFCSTYSIASRHTPTSSQIHVPIITFFFIEELCTLNYEKSITHFKIQFEIEHKKFIQFLLFYTIASALLSTFSVSFFLWFIGISLFVFLGIRLFYTRLFISSVINQISISEDTDEILSKQQEQWVQNPHVCPACGTEITKYTRNCSECGLFIQQIPPVSRFSVSENLDSYTLNYTISNEKD